ncbi:MAG: hypothetical protein ABI718_05685 [Acidobacteriota bacterium]
MNERTQSADSIILRFRDGSTESCTDCGVDLDREIVEASDSQESHREIPFSELKAVFYLQQGLVDREVPDPTPEGKTVAVEFQDGEVIRGISPEYRPDRKGFVVYPLDRSKNDRIFVLQSAIISIDIEKF